MLHATDRQSIVDQIIKPAVREGRVLQSFIVPTFPEYFSPTFAEYDYDLGKVEQLMTGEGWAKGSDGNPVAVRMSAFDGDPRVRPSLRQFVAYAAAWEPIPDDGLPRYPERRPT